MKSISHNLLALFLALLALHLGLSMELPVIAWLGGGLSLFAALQIVRLEHPTWGLTFVLLAAGGFIGSQILEDWALEGSWAQENGLVAGLVLSLFVYLLWVFAARAKSDPQLVLDRATQTILVLGLIMMILISPPPAAVVVGWGVQVPVITTIAMLLAGLVLLADRCAGFLPSRLLLLLPLLLLIPLMMMVLSAGQRPIIAALGNLFPESSNYTPTGFSPYQTLRASVFLRPSTRAVMRVESSSPPNRYLAGNRLVTLTDELVWMPSAQPLRSYSSLDASPQPNGEWRYNIDNHHYSPFFAPQEVEPQDLRPAEGSEQSLTVHSLSNDDYVFVSPGTSHITGRFAAIARNAADVWTPAYDRGADERWQLETNGRPVPDIINDENLQLPSFWDDSLETKAEEFLADGKQQTVDNIVNHFTGRRYSLRTNFDPQKPFHDFFLNDREGYCFWFATAATLALRANGIPSRLIGGYVIHEQLTSDLWLVRGRDAHSWVEWQDDEGFWHTVDPTPASIETFFSGYESNPFSTWYHTAAGMWQRLIDRILEDEFTANLVQWGGLLVLVFLFVREYRRIRGRTDTRDKQAQQWLKLWERFLSLTKLPAKPAWTATTYSENLPANWPENYKAFAKQFLQNYSLRRFSDNNVAIQETQEALDKLSTAVSQSSDNP